MREHQEFSQGQKEYVELYDELMKWDELMSSIAPTIILKFEI